MTKIGIIYGTSGGNTKLVCQKIASVLEHHGFSPVLHRVVESTPNVFDDYHYMVLASPTYGHGELDPHIISFYENLQGNVDFSKKYFGVVGLGDNKYDDDYTIESARILKDFVLDHDGEMLQEPLMIHKSPVPHLETAVKEWAERLAQKIKQT